MMFFNSQLKSRLMLLADAYQFHMDRAINHDLLQTLIKRKARATSGGQYNPKCTFRNQYKDWLVLPAGPTDSKLYSSLGKTIAR